jgi:hypothetical protein
MLLVLRRGNDVIYDIINHRTFVDIAFINLWVLVHHLWLNSSFFIHNVPIRNRSKNFSRQLALWKVIRKLPWPNPRQMHVNKSSALHCFQSKQSTLRYDFSTSSSTFTSFHVSSSFMLWIKSHSIGTFFHTQCLCSCSYF